MSTTQYSLILGAALLLTLAAQMVNGPNVTAGKCLNQTGCSPCCPECNHCCSLDAKMGAVEKKCFEVEKEVICIPRVVFPWQVGKSCFPFCKSKKCRSCDVCDGHGCSACVHNGAKTRTVKILKSRKYKCPKCEYVWTPERTNCGPCCDSCENPGCCDGNCDAGFAPAPIAGHQGVPTYTEPSSNGLEPIDVQQN